jgi:hypothetical protein
VQGSIDSASQRSFDLGAVALDAWDDWVVHVLFSPLASHGFLRVWRNGRLALPLTRLATAYNDTRPPYLKFGVYKGSWKGRSPQVRTATWAAISYGEMKVGDQDSSFAEVSTAQHDQGSLYAEGSSAQRDQDASAAVASSAQRDEDSSSAAVSSERSSAGGTSPTAAAVGTRPPHLLLLVGDDMGANVSALPLERTTHLRECSAPRPSCENACCSVP